MNRRSFLQLLSGFLSFLGFGTRLSSAEKWGKVPLETVKPPESVKTLEIAPSFYQIYPPVWYLSENGSPPPYIGPERCDSHGLPPGKVIRRKLKQKRYT